jgi:hypothetical protein
MEKWTIAVRKNGKGVWKALTFLIQSSRTFQYGWIESINHSLLESVEGFSDWVEGQFD